MGQPGFPPELLSVFIRFFKVSAFQEGLMAHTTVVLSPPGRSHLLWLVPSRAWSVYPGLAGEIQRRRGDRAWERVKEREVKKKVEKKK